MKFIKNYENIYSITDSGNIFAHPKKGSGGHNGKWLIPYKNKKGYYCIKLCKNNTKKSFLINVLVITHFSIKPSENLICNHKDGNKLNNHISNLEWATYSENIKHAYDNNLRKVSNFTIERMRNLGIERTGKPCEKRKVLSKDQLLEIKNLYYTDRIPSRKLASLFFVSKTTILKVIKGTYGMDYVTRNQAKV